MPAIYEDRLALNRGDQPAPVLQAPGPQRDVLDHKNGLRGNNSTSSSGQPVAPVGGFTGTGQRIHTYFDDFYFTYHITPAKIDVGTLTAETDIPMSIWSAYFEPHTLTGISIVNDTGIWVGLSTPRTFAPLESIDTTLTVGLEGPAAIDAHVLFSFDNLTPQVSVTGMRVVLMELPPNWKTPVADRFAFKTEIFTARNGHEQRRARRKNPRRTVTFEVLANAEKQHYLTRLLATKGDLTIVFPDYVRRVKLTTQVLDTDTEVSVAEVPEWLLPGALVVLADPGNTTMRSALVDAVDAATKIVTLHSPIGVGFSAKAKLFLGLPGKVPTKNTMVRRAGTVTTARLSLDVNPGALVWWARTWPEEFDGRKLFRIAPNWRAAPSTTILSARETLDFGFGRIATNAPVPYLSQDFAAEWTMLNAEQAKKIEDFFILHKGSTHSFWVPSFVQDFMPMEDLINGQHILRVRGQDFYSGYVDSPLHAAYRVLLKDGTELLRKVTAIVKVDDATGHDTHIVANEAWPQTIPVSDVVSCQWLFRARFASDNLDLTWLTRTVAQAKLTFRVLEAN